MQPICNQHKLNVVHYRQPSLSHLSDDVYCAIDSFPAVYLDVIYILFLENENARQGTFVFDNDATRDFDCNPFKYSDICLLLLCGG